MQNFRIVFEKNEFNRGLQIKKRLRIDKGRVHYSIKTDVFCGDHILEMIEVVKYIDDNYPANIPITFDLGKFEFYDKLVWTYVNTLDTKS